MAKCTRSCWPGYRRVKGKGCGKGSCVKKGKKVKRTRKRESDRSKRVRRRAQKKRKARGTKRRTHRIGRKKSRKSKMKCNRVKKSYRPGKKFMVKACSRGREKLIHFGAKGYGHNYSKKARKSYRARHRCKTAKDKLTARYWSCKHSWTKGGSKKRCPKGRRCKK